MPSLTQTGDRLTPAEWLGVLAATGLCFGAHAIYGANTDARALLLVIGQGLVLLSLLALPTLRAALAARRGALALPAGLFALTILIGLQPFVRGLGGGAGASDAVLECVKLCGLGCAFLIGVMLGGRDERARGFLLLWIGCGGVYAAASLYAFKVNPQSLGLGHKTLFLDRLTGAFVSPNSAATLLGMIVVLAVAAALEGRRGATAGGRGPTLDAALSLAAGGAALTALVLTASRAGLVSTLAALAVLLAAHAVANRDRLTLRAWGVGLAGALVVAAVIALAGGQVIGRLIDLNSADRAGILNDHWRAFLAHPWLGYGLGSFDSVNKSLITPSSYGYLWNIRAAHNVYLQWLEEGGVVGALPMFATVAVILGSIAWGAATRKSMRSWLRGLLALSLVVLLHGLSDYALQVPSIASNWAMLLGVGVAVAAGRRGVRAKPGRAATSEYLSPASRPAAGRPFASGTAS